MIPPLVDLTARTLPELYEASLQLLRTRIGDFAYNDAVATGVAPGILLVLAWQQEQNAFYYDRRRRNSLLFLADTVESMKILTRAQGYRMRPATAASVAVIAEPNPPQPANITLVAGTQVVVGDLIFELVNDAVIPPSVPGWPDGTTDDLIVLTEGRTQVDRFQSNGEVWQSFELELPGIIDGSVTVLVNGEPWEEVPSLVFVEGTQQGRDEYEGTGLDGQTFELSLLNAITDLGDEDGITILVFPTGVTQDNVQTWQQVESFTGAPREFVAQTTPDGVVDILFGAAGDGAAPSVGARVVVLYLIAGAQKRFQLNFDEFDSGSVTFGNDVFGLIPPNGADIEVSYRVGGGARGNVRPSSIDVTIQGVLPSGAGAAVRLRNFERGSGGEPPETVEEARFNAPRFAKSNNRAVRKEDWIVHARTYIDPVFGAPSHANAFLKQRVPELNTVVVPIWGRDELGRIATPGTPLKVGVKRYLDTRRTFTTVVEVEDGEIVLFDVEVSILLDQGATRQVVFTQVSQAIDRFFNSAFVRPGVDFPVGGLYQTIENVDGVDRANIDNIRGSRLIQFQVGVGDGNETAFTGDFPLEDGTAVVQESVVIADASQQIVDNGEGSFTGDVDASVLPGPGNTIDYTDGKFEVTFENPPAVNAVITAEAKVDVFFATVEEIGTSDGSVNEIDGATRFYPILQRPPRGVWSGDLSRVVDGDRVGASAQFRGTLPNGILPNSPPIPRPLRFIDSSVPPQIVEDNGVGVLTQGGPSVGTVSYVTGVYNFTFTSLPVLPVRAEWSTNTVDFIVPDEFLPLTPGRLFFWGGFSADGTQGAAAELFAFDDGEGNIVGDVLAGGTVIYDSGRVTFEWNTTPPPGISGGASLFGRLVEVPDGIRTEFTFQVRTLGGGLGALVDISAQSGADGEGRTKFQLSDLSVPGLTFEDAYDNWQGNIDGDSLDRENPNFVTYPVGTGTLNFLQPPQAVTNPTGSITTVPQAQIVDGETVVIDDGLNPAVTFEFDTVPDGVTGGNIVVDISAAVTDEDVRDALVTAINGVAALAVVASPGAATNVVDLVNNVNGVQGNVAITDTVVDAGFLVAGFSGGNGTPQDFPIQITNAAVYMVSTWVFRVKTPTGPGLDKSLFTDNNGRLWGDSVNAFPIDRLDFLRGRFVATLAGSPIAAGRALELTYDALSGVPPVRDIPVAGNQIAVLGRVTLLEEPPEVEASA